MPRIAAQHVEARQKSRPEAFASSRNAKLFLQHDRGIVDANPAALNLWSLPAEKLIGMSFPDCFTHPEEARRMLADAGKRGRARERLLELQARPGVALRCSAAHVEGDSLRMLVTVRTIAGKKGQQNSTFEYQDRFRLAFESCAVGLGMVDLEGDIFEANRAMTEIFGLSKAQLKKTNLLDLWAPEECLEALADFKNAACGSRARTVFEARLVNRHGDPLFAEVTRTLVRSESGHPLYFTFSVRDITETKRQQVLLEKQASTDPLTGVLNRNRIEERARFELMRSDRYGDRVSMVMMDLDHFKAVNDTYGHSAGDRVLRGFCDVARSCLRSIDLLGRWGGEEFVALLPETGVEGAKIVAERLRLTLEGFKFGGDMQVTVSMGVAGHREDENFASQIGRADACLYQAKREGRNRVVIDQQDADREAAAKDLSPRLLMLHWKPSYRCGHPVLDAEHQELFHLANRIIVAITDGATGPAIFPLVRGLIALVRDHLRNEEEILHAAGFSEAADHEEIHREFEKRVVAQADRFERGEDSEADLLRFLIHDIVAKHMLQDDRKFFPLFAPNLV